MLYFLFPFKLFVSILLKHIPCGQHVVGTCLFIQSDSLCLLIVIFRQFTFNAIIDISRFKPFLYLSHLVIVTFLSLFLPFLN